MDSFERRLIAVEERLGVGQGQSPEDLSHRLSTVENQFHSVLKAGSLRSTWIESNQWLEELDPGVALSHQQLSATPVFYRRQEILASAESFHESMKQTGQILALLSIGQDIKGGKISEDQVTQAPIVTDVKISEEDSTRLGEVAEMLHDLHQRSGETTKKLERILDEYYGLMEALSEKTVLLDESLTRRGV